jgi:acetolactate synthase-1/2/3 large subunit
VQGDASATLHALADRLEAAQRSGQTQVDARLHADVAAARLAAETQVNDSLGPYVALKDALQQQSQLAGKPLWWVRDITLSNSMWGNRAPRLDHPRAGVHALGGGIGQGLAMGIGTAVANAVHGLGRKTVVLAGDGGFMLNLGELACAAQEQADLVVILMNDAQYGVIRNIQDDIYGSRHAYVDLHTPQFAQLCASLQVQHVRIDAASQCADALGQALRTPGPVVVEVDMKRFGSFAVKFAGPILKKD